MSRPRNFQRRDPVDPKLTFIEDTIKSGRNKLNDRLKKKLIKLKQEKKILIDELERLGVDTKQLLNKRGSNEDTES